MAQRVGVTQQTWSKWVAGKHGDEAYLRIAQFVNDYFRAEPRISPDEVAGQDLWELVLERGEGLRPDRPVDKKSFSRWSLGQLLQDLGFRRIFKPSGELTSRLEALVNELRDDLDREDWLAIARLLNEDPHVDLWMYRDPSLYRVPVFFKTDMKLTPRELSRFQREVLDKVIAERAKKLRHEEKKK